MQPRSRDWGQDPQDSPKRLFQSSILGGQVWPVKGSFEGQSLRRSSILKSNEPTMCVIQRIVVAQSLQGRYGPAMFFSTAAWSWLNTCAIGQGFVILYKILHHLVQVLNPRSFESPKLAHLMRSQLFWNPASLGTRKISTSFDPQSTAASPHISPHKRHSTAPQPAPAIKQTEPWSKRMLEIETS